MTPKYVNGKRSNKSELKLQKLKENKLEELAKKLDSDIRGYDHIVQYADNHTASLRSDWVDENIQIVIDQHNIEIEKVKKMTTADFSQNEIKQVTET